MNYDSCPCSGNTLDRFLRPTVMAILSETSKGIHGYMIAHRLNDVAIFKGNPPNNAGLYRTLKAMETEGMVSSNWDTKGNGPAKRIYVLTDEGRECLRQWVGTLETYSKNLQKTVKFITQRLPARKRSKEMH